MKISADAFVDFLEQVNGAKSDTIGEAVIDVEANRLICRATNMGKARQVSVIWNFATPMVEPAPALVVGNLPEFIKALKRFKGDIEVAFNPETGNIHVSNEQKQFAWPQLSELTIDNRGKELLFEYKTSFTMEEETMKDILGDMKTVGDKPSLVLEHKKGDSDATIMFSTGARFASFTSKFPVSDKEIEFRLATLMFGILEASEGPVTFRIVNAQMPIQVTYKTSSGVEVEHLLAPFIESE